MKPVIDVEKMLEMKGAGMTNADIARALGVTTSAVWQQLRKLEVNIENAKSKTEASQPEPAEEVKEEQVQEETVDGFPEVEQAEEPASQVESPLERLNRDMAELHRQFKHLANITDVFNIIRDSFGTDTANRCLELIRPILDGEAI
jgi:predicted transcriptional regulator